MVRSGPEFRSGHNETPNRRGHSRCRAYRWSNQYRFLAVKGTAIFVFLDTLGSSYDSFGINAGGLAPFGRQISLSAPVIVSS